jgi:hypothetical protein
VAVIMLAAGGDTRPTEEMTSPGMPTPGRVNNSSHVTTADLVGQSSWRDLFGSRWR